MSFLKKDPEQIVDENMVDPRDAAKTDLEKVPYDGHDPRSDAAMTRSRNVDDLVHDPKRMSSDEVPASDKEVAMHNKSVTADAQDKNKGY